ncbi:radical SAM protein, partial [Candidatus Desantisbacteria bacterium]|nr:radical SAM protein [Candidatus Desantisbacteria bacterium]
DEFPGIGHLIGVGEISKIYQAIVAKPSQIVAESSRLVEDTKRDASSTRIIATLPHTAYVKIADGCDNCCSYCLIPALRGKYQSRDIDSIVKEVEELVNVVGTHEINLIAQDITLYGMDTHNRLMLPELLKQSSTNLCSLPATRR